MKDELIERPYLIRKGGYWYRPNSQGYTPCARQAGRYTLAEAIDLSHPNGPDGPRDGIDYVHEKDLPPEAAQQGEADNARIASLEKAGRNILPYLRWTIGPESPGYHPTMPSAVEAFARALTQEATNMSAKSGLHVALENDKVARAPHHVLGESERGD
jgi:hypothetical protein